MARMEARGKGIAEHPGHALALLCLAWQPSTGMDVALI